MSMPTSTVRVLVTGASGLVGNAIKWNYQNKPKYSDVEFMFLQESEADLRDRAQTMAAFEKYRPTHVIHLAAIVVRPIADDRRTHNVLTLSIAGRLI